MGTGHPRARPHSGGGSCGGGKGQAERARMGHTEGDRKGGKREFTPGWGREEKEREKREKEKPGRGMPSLHSGMGWVGAALQRAALVGWPGRGTETPPQGAPGDSQGEADRERPSQYKAKAAEGQGWECVRV